MSRDGTGRNEVVQQQRVEGTKRTTWTLHSLIDRFGGRVYAMWIVASGPRVLDVVLLLELLEAFGPRIVDILSIADELRRRRRSVGGRHFKWRTGGWFKGQRLKLLLSAHDRHALLWSSLPLPRNSSIRRPDKPQIFFIHSDLKLLGMWCYFYLRLTHPCSIFVTPLSSDPPLSPITPLDLPR